DTTFDIGLGFGDFVEAIAFVPDGSGRIYVAGRFTTFQAFSVGHIVRLNPDGSMDGTFVTGMGFDSDADVLLPISGSSQFYVGGAFTHYGFLDAGGVARLNADGSLDTSFQTVAGIAFDQEVQALALSGDGSGKIYAGGSFSSYDNVTIPAGGILRLN